MLSGVKRGGLVFSIVLVTALSACATIMDVEAPVLIDPTLPLDEGGSRDADAAAAPEALAPADSGCIGSGCPCDENKDCLDTTFTQCIEGKCGQCTNDPSDTCPDGLYCLPTHECAPGCKSDAECARIAPGAPYCNVARHQCVSCRGPDDCKALPNQECGPSGVCADKCTSDAGGAGSCDDGKACCNGLCVDTADDAFNCGACGNTCSGASPRCCNGLCADTQNDEDNCGACGTACVTTNGQPSCLAGSCRWNCNPGYSHCAQGNTGCETSTSSNTTQCGNCVTNCNNTVANATGVTCASSTCNYASCKGGFLDEDGNRRNGCETVCGVTNGPCCSPPNGGCSGTDYCSGTTCLACKANGTACSAEKECCSGNCHPNGKCR